ncbi:hypothetical protein ACFE04_007743 [Oxalis oulophora]
MESDLGKLFIGGISWDTDEERLKEYFGKYGEVIEAVIMRDRTTGRARGFGFIVFSDPIVAERVIMDKHMIDGRTVEAKKAVPRDDQNLSVRNIAVIQGSPAPGRTKKIFVGGLASTVTENDFKIYFEQFGTITDVVVMYDHNTQRPRGFGFITYDSEDAVDRVLHKTFHELNGKMVEVKRAVPKELSPATPSRLPLVGFNHGLSRVNLLNNFAQGYNVNSFGGFGVGLDGRFSPISSARSGLSPFRMNLESSYGGNSNFGNSLGYTRMLNPHFGDSPNRYNTPIGFPGGLGRNHSVMASPNRNLWGNGSLSSGQNPMSPGSYLASGFGNFGVSFENNGGNWNQSSGGRVSGGTMNYGNPDSNYGIGGGAYGRFSSMSTGAIPSFNGPSGGLEVSYEDIYRSSSVYGDSTWRSAETEFDGSGSFGFGLRIEDADVSITGPEGYVGSYGVPSRQTNSGIAA